MMPIELRITFNFSLLPSDNPNDLYKFIRRRVCVAVADTLKVLGSKNVKVEVIC